MTCGRYVIGALLLALVAGCRPSVEWLDDRDRAEPLMKRARMKRNEGDIDGAIELYREALRAEQRMGLANLDLALLLHDEKKDYVGAVSHYMQYLDMRPETEKSRMIRKRMELALQAYVAQQAQVSATRPPVQPDLGPAEPPVADGGGVQQLRAELAAARRQLAVVEQSRASLREQNRVLDSTVRRLRSEIDQLAAVRDAAIESTDGESGRPRVRTRTYEVMPGDSLSSIASAVYGDGSKWRAIYEANQEVLGGSERLRPGQVLVIP